MANDRDDVTMPAHFRAQDTEAIVCVVVSNALYKARQHFMG